jgi:hypothetical protein
MNRTVYFGPSVVGTCRHFSWWLPPWPSPPLHCLILGSLKSCVYYWSAWYLTQTWFEQTWKFDPRSLIRRFSLGIYNLDQKKKISSFQVSGDIMSNKLSSCSEHHFVIWTRSRGTVICREWITKETRKQRQRWEADEEFHWVMFFLGPYLIYSYPWALWGN